MDSFSIQSSAVKLWSLLTLIVLVTGCASHSPGHVGGQPRLEQPPVAGVPGPLREVFQRYEGTPYRYGGTGAQGFDCSGFIQTAYREAYGLSLPRTTDALRSTGYGVAPEQMQPGDLVFFRIRGKEQHAGIYMGNQRFIHASTSVGVTESLLTGDYWAPRLSRVRRID